jgi:small subunit ribosomal protein S20
MAVGLNFPVLKIDKKINRGKKSMAHHKSAVKRIRQSEVRRMRNRHIKKQLSTAIKNVKDAESREDGEAKLKVAVSLLDKISGKGLIHRNKAANQKSKLTRRVATLS